MLDLYCTDPAHPIVTAGWNVDDDPDRVLSDLSDVRKRLPRSLSLQKAYPKVLSLRKNS